MKIDDIVEFEGKRWRIIGIGNTDEDGATYYHLSSTTEFRQQKNGPVPRQIAHWFLPGALTEVEDG